MCTAGVRRLGRIVERRGFALAPLQADWVAARMGAPPEDLMREMRVLTVDGRVCGGVDAFVCLARYVWWAWPLYLLALVPGVRTLLRPIYRFIARHRHAIGGTCPLPTASDSHAANSERVSGGDTSKRLGKLVAWLPLAGLPAVVLLMHAHLPAWGVCWGLAFAIYVGCKWLTWWDARRLARTASLGRNLGCLLAWPGMDAKAFLGPKTEDRNPKTEITATTHGRAAAASLGFRFSDFGFQWLAAALKTAIGLGLVFVVARQVPAAQPLLAGWIVMIGLILTLHFGLFHLLALAWRRSGVDAVPLMHSPALSTSLADFWGARWNLAFRDLSYAYLFRPLRRPLGVAGASVTTFLVSGLVHDLLISFPAGAGYGGPTLFFLLQAAGMLFERSAIGRSLGLGRGVKGWLFTLLLTIGPAYWLFHPAFVMRVIVPMAQALGAL